MSAMVFVRSTSTLQWKKLSRRPSFTMLFFFVLAKGLRASLGEKTFNVGCRCCHCHRCRREAGARPPVQGGRQDDAELASLLRGQVAGAPAGTISVYVGERDVRLHAWVGQIVTFFAYADTTLETSAKHEENKTMDTDRKKNRPRKLCTPPR
eukprot:scaffold45357_cov78-Phaeocystis_antarctica.AAC.1